MTSWEDQAALFKFAITEYGGVDTVVTSGKTDRAEKMSTLWEEMFVGKYPEYTLFYRE